MEQSEILHQINEIFEHHTHAVCEEDDWGLGIDWNVYFFNGSEYYIKFVLDYNEMYLYHIKGKSYQPVGSVKRSFFKWTKQQKETNLVFSTVQKTAKSFWEEAKSKGKILNYVEY